MTVDPFARARSLTHYHGRNYRGGLCSVQECLNQIARQHLRRDTKQELQMALVDLAEDGDLGWFFELTEADLDDDTDWYDRPLSKHQIAMRRADEERWREIEYRAAVLEEADLRRDEAMRSLLKLRLCA